MDMDKIFREKLKELIKDSGSTYDEIKDRFGIKSKGTLTKYCNGQIKNIPLGMVDKTARVFNVSPAWLLGCSDDKYGKK